jgi:hypothetical protein
MSKVDITTAVDTANHFQAEYEYLKIFVRFPQDQRKYTFVNGTASERTIAAGTLCGILTSDQTIVQPVESDATDGSQKPVCITMADIVIAAGASIEVEALLGFDGSFYADKVVLEKSGDTLDTLITEEGQSIRLALKSYNNDLSIVDAAVEQSDYMNSQV